MSQGGVPPASVVEGFDVLEDRRPRRLTGRSGVAVDQLPLQSRDEVLGALPRPTDRGRRRGGAGADVDCVRDRANTLLIPLLHALPDLASSPCCPRMLLNR